MRLHSIQILRALAALLVVGFHISGIQATNAAASLGADRAGADWPILENGFAGVDLFFVISGFIMVVVTGAGARGPGAAGLFVVSRAVRIYPPWWLFAALATAYMALAYGLTNTGEGGWANLAGTTSVAEYLTKSFLLIPQERYPVLNVGWTLVHEMYFYLVFAFTLLFARRWLVPILIVWAGLVVTFSLLGYSDTLGRDLLTLAVHPMTLEFILGAFAGIAVCSGRRFAPAFLAALATVWLAAALVFTLPPADTVPQADGLIAMTGHQFSFVTGTAWSVFVLEWGRVIVFGLPCALLVYALASLDVDGRLPRVRPLEVLGDWSYALYLSHILVLVGLARLFPEFAAGPLYAVVALPATLVVAGLAYALFERPLMAAFSAWRRRTFSASESHLHPAPMAARVW